MAPRKLFPILIFCCLLLFNSITYAHDMSNCKIPKEVSQNVKKAFPDYNIVKPEDLKKDDLKMFRKDHGNKCPGFIKVNFYGTGEQTYALLLNKRTQGISDYKLVVMSKANETIKWQIKEIEGNIDSASAIWEEPSGEYEGVLDGKKINAKYPVILLVGYESWAIVFSWTGSEVTKVWISD